MGRSYTLTVITSQGVAVLARIVCKFYEYLCRLITVVIRMGTADPTTILLNHQTEAQMAAALAMEQQGGTETAGRVTVLVVIPFRDRWSLTQACLDSLLKQRLGAHVRLQITLVDNGSVDADTKRGVGALVSGALPPGFTINVLRIDAPFNYSQLMNQACAAGAAFSPDLLLLLNNDVEFLRPDDLEQLIAFAARCPNLGALGCTLCYQDGRVQHLFAAPGVKIVAAHPFKGRRLSASHAWFAAPRPVAAVTGAAMLVPTKAFLAAGGFNESLPTVGQDIDLCLKLQRLDLVNWTLPSVRLMHHEGLSRGHSIAKDEVRLMYQTWGDFLTANPYYSSRFTRFSETPAYALGHPRYPWERVLV